MFYNQFRSLFTFYFDFLWCEYAHFFATLAISQTKMRFITKARDEGSLNNCYIS